MLLSIGKRRRLTGEEAARDPSQRRGMKRAAGIQRGTEMQIASDNSSTVDVMVTRGVEGRPPDVWLRLLSERTSPMLVRLTIDEARELANLLLFEANRARENNDV